MALLGFIVTASACFAARHHLSTEVPATWSNLVQLGVPACGCLWCEESPKHVIPRMCALTVLCAQVLVTIAVANSIRLPFTVGSSSQSSLQSRQWRGRIVLQLELMSSACTLGLLPALDRDSPTPATAGSPWDSSAPSAGMKQACYAYMLTWTRILHSDALQSHTPLSSSLLLCAGHL